MAFFKKLKDRLFQSSSKIDEGLEAIVEDGGQEDEVTAQDVVEPEPQVEVVEVPEPIQGEPKTLRSKRLK